jgi:hypothetical protein
MVGPLWVAVSGSGCGHHRSCRRQRWWVTLGMLLAGLVVATTFATRH